MITSYEVKGAYGQVTNASPDLTLVAAQTGKTIYLLRGVISMLVTATGGGGRVALENGVDGSRILEVDGNSVLAGHFPFDFGEEGIPLSQNTLLNATSDSAITTQATAHVSVVVKIV